MNCIVAKEGNLFAGTSDGVFRSTDGGSSWTAVNKGLSIVYTSMVYSLAVVSSSGGGGGTNLFAGVEDGGIWRSTDDGDNWMWVYPGGVLGEHAINIIALGAAGSTILAGVESQLGQTGVYR